MKAVYRCLSFEQVDGVLVVYDPELVGVVDSPEEFEELVKEIKYSSIVCPEIYLQASEVKQVLLKYIS